MNTEFYLKLAIFAVGAFLIGGIPFGYIIGKLNGKDIRKEGSCNIGATNVTRVVGKWWGKLCFLLDFLKGALPVTAAVLLSKDDPYGILPAVTAFLVVAGHIWPVYLKFKGGKGVATAAGAFLPLSWAAIVTALIVWALVFLTTRYVSLASITAAVIFALTAVIFYIIFPELSLFPGYKTGVACLIPIVLLSILTIVKHRSNIKRLLEGTENRFEKAKKDE
ncbi:MAG: glycerol-3-phosphate 1-O-acyltransferase PlsY [Lentisphaeria bacterium]|nr:glycerol-3-phosphate 1-O-acyltransferase PlsY [Lentisphaeria bacterium]